MDNQQEFSLESLERDIIPSELEAPSTQQQDDQLANSIQSDQLSAELADIEKEKARLQHDMDQNWKALFASLFQKGFLFLWFCFLVLCAVLLFHWVAPDHWRWLKPDEIDKIQTFVAAVFASKVVGSKLDKT